MVKKIDIRQGDIKRAVRVSDGQRIYRLDGMILDLTEKQRLLLPHLHNKNIRIHGELEDNTFMVHHISIPPGNYNKDSIEWQEELEENRRIRASLKR